MKKRYRVLPYKQGSKGAKALASEMGGLVLKTEGSTFKPREGDVVVNWGSSSHTGCTTHNKDGERLSNATNKLLFFRAMRETGLTPEFWETKSAIPEGAYPVVARTILNGHSGAGIVIASTPDSLPNCSLYVKYEKKRDEYRVHVGRGGKLISLQQKKRRNGVENPNWQIRNHDNGFIYAREGVNPPKQVIDAAHRTLEVLDLDFGAVDVIWNNTQERAYVLEINTAPGLEGQTVRDYARFFRGE